ncbi:MAG: valine--tRNA ligase, partial [Pseudomonadota bacterium]|nr:valine--tRNA ligase [Pseudomonadota bacterium]
NDYAVWQRHRDHSSIQALPHGGLVNLFTVDAAIRSNEEDEDGLIPEAYVGLDRFAARKQIVADLDAQGLLVKIDDHKLMVPRGDRSNSVIEPFLTDQWYVKTAPLAKPAIEAVESGKIRFVPDNWKNTYFEWMNNIEDWCISRQIWWGHRIPAWYDQEGNVYVGRSEEEVRAKHNLPADYALQQDEDVLDTWFSSALWPFSTLGWPEDTQRLKSFYPTSVLVTGFDIIFFWVARMIMMGLKFMDDVPFHEVYIHGLVRDSHGQKMSKSKGNVLDPIDLIDGIELEPLVIKRTTGLMQPENAPKIEKMTRKDFPDGIPAFGTDALRFTFAALASTGRDINFDMGRVEGYRNFCNKIWNAARYVLMNSEGKDCGQHGGSDNEIELSIADRWILSRLQQTTDTTGKSIDSYRLDHAARAIYEFTWNHYCDWYLELSKTILNSDNASEAAKRGTRQTLVQVLEQLLRLAHPLIPFISEEIWQRIAPLAGVSGETISLQPYPAADASRIDAQAVEEMEWVMQFILGIRKIKGEMNIAPGKRVPVLLVNTTEADHQRAVDNRAYLDFLAKTESIEILTEGEDAPESATALVGEMRVLIPMAGLIDVEAERQRLQKEIGRLGADRERTEKKLSNPNFVDKAPQAVVQKERVKLEESKTALENLQQQLEKLAAL